MPRDHRNNPVSLFRSSWNTNWRSIGSSEYARRNTRILRHFMRMTDSIGVYIIVPVIAMFLICVPIAYWYLHTFKGGSVLVGGAIGLVPAMIASFVLHSAYRSVHHKGRVFVESCLLEDCCPVCGYRLKGLAQEADGCVQCPECGAHWKPYIMPPEQ